MGKITEVDEGECDSLEEFTSALFWPFCALVVLSLFCGDNVLLVGFVSGLAAVYFFAMSIVEAGRERPSAFWVAAYCVLAFVITVNACLGFWFIPNFRG